MTQEAGTQHGSALQAVGLMFRNLNNEIYFLYTSFHRRERAALRIKNESFIKASQAKN